MSRQIPKRVFISCFIVILVPLLIWMYFQYQDDTLEEKTMQLLIQEGYSEDEIDSISNIEPYGSGFIAEVIFVDEPHVIYGLLSDRYENNEGMFLLAPNEPFDSYDPEPKRFHQ